MNRTACARRELTRTHHDANPLPAIPDSQATGEAIFRRARNLWTTPAQIARALDEALAMPTEDPAPCVYCGCDAVTAAVLTNGYLRWDYCNFAPGTHTVCKLVKLSKPASGLRGLSGLSRLRSTSTQRHLLRSKCDEPTQNR